MTETAIQLGVSIAVGSYRAASQFLTAEERADLRSILALAIAKDRAAAIGAPYDLNEAA